MTEPEPRSIRALRVEMNQLEANIRDRKQELENYQLCVRSTADAISRLEEQKKELQLDIAALKSFRSTS